MYEYIKGRIASVQDKYMVLENGGIGYKIYAPMPTMEKLREQKGEVTVYTYLYLQEGIMDLYGFASQADIGCFRLLLSVSGVGPKAALAILTELGGEKLAFSVVTEDSKALTRASGVGPKLAKRIILELKDKIHNDDLPGSTQNLADMAASAGDDRMEAVNALMVLGYSRPEAMTALSKVDTAGMTLEQMIKAALKALMKV